MAPQWQTSEGMQEQSSVAPHDAGRITQLGSGQFCSHPSIFIKTPQGLCVVPLGQTPLAGSA
jgi:hypothetical protein